MTTEALPKIRGMEVAISSEDRERILCGLREVLESGWLMWGPWQERLCDGLQRLTGRAHAVTFNSCTSAVEVLFRYLQPAAVCFQANVFPSPVFAARRAGVPVTWSDIDPVQMCPTVLELEAAYLESQFDALLIQWTAGFIPSCVEEILQWCRDRRVFLIEDASHAAGSVQADRPAGAFGDAAVLSLAATKPLQSGQGGVLLTDDATLAEFAFQMKNYGRTEMFQRGEYVREGWNMHMTELQGVVGSVLLESMNQAISYRRSLAEAMLHPVERWYERLGSWQGASCRPNVYKLPLLPRSRRKADVLEALAQLNIEAGSSVYDFVTPHLAVFGGEYGAVELPKCSSFAESHVCLPLHNGMTMEDAERVSLALAKAAK